MISRRGFIKWSAATGAWIYVGGVTGCTKRIAEKTATPPHPWDAWTPRQSASSPRHSSFRLPRAKAPESGDQIDYYEISKS